MSIRQDRNFRIGNSIRESRLPMDAGSAVKIAIYEFPEAVARSLLTASALNDEALRVTI